jgi:urea carboxylase
MKTRYTFGGDEHIFVEVDEEMSLDAFFKSLTMSKAVQAANLPGVIDICPGNASLQVRFDPEITHPDKMMDAVKNLEETDGATPGRLTTRIIEVPVYYQDPWTQETVMRFRERHQDPSGTDLEYAARINGYDSVDDFIIAHHSAPAKVSSSAHGYPQTDRRLWRLLYGDLFGAGRWRLSDVRHHADDNL